MHRAGCGQSDLETFLKSSIFAVGCELAAVGLNRTVMRGSDNWETCADELPPVKYCKNVKKTYNLVRGRGDSSRLRAGS